MNPNDPDFYKEQYREEILRLIMEEAERMASLKEGEFPTATVTIEILPDQGMNTSASENGKSASG